MAFPTTPQLDNFTRPNENPLSQGGNWAGPIFSGDSVLQIISNLCVGNFSAFSESYRANTVYGPNSEAWCVVPTVEAIFGQIELYVRLQTPNTAGVDGYFLHVGVPDIFQIYRIDNAAQTQLGATANQTISNGDSLGIQMIGNVITGWYRSGSGAWATILTRTDSTYASAGNIGMLIFNDGTKVNSFGGGTFGAGKKNSLPLLGV